MPMYNHEQVSPLILALCEKPRRDSDRFLRLFKFHGCFPYSYLVSHVNPEPYFSVSRSAMYSTVTSGFSYFSTKLTQYSYSKAQIQASSDDYYRINFE